MVRKWPSRDRACPVPTIANIYVIFAFVGDELNLWQKLILLATTIANKDDWMQ